MKDIVNEFISIKNKINKHFNCDENFFISPLSDYSWNIKNNDGIFILTYWNKDNIAKECVVAKKNNSPLILEREKYTMIIAIECVKVAFIFSNSNKINAM